MIAKISNSGWAYVLILVFYTIGLWGMSVPLTGDQKVYLSIALEMKERGSFIVPYLFGEPNFLKPPFQYWATLLGWKVFGISLFGALLPSVLALIASAILVNRIFMRLNQGNSNLLPGIFFASSIGTMTYGTTAQMEIWIVLFYLWAWSLFLEEKFIQALLVAGVMAWIKGPLYPVLFVLSTFLYFILSKQARLFFSMRYLVSLCLSVLVALSWYAAAAFTEWDAMVNVFFLRENIGKISTVQGTPWGLWGEFLYSLFPWLLWFVAGLFDRNQRARIRSNRIFWISFALIPAVFFTFFPYRVYTYLYLLTPLASWWIVTISPEKSRLLTVIASTSSTIAAVLSVLVMRLTMGKWIGVEIGFSLIAVLIIWSFAHWKRSALLIAFSSLVMVNLIRMGAVEIGEKDIAGLRAYHAAHSSSDATFAYFVDQKDIWHEFGLISSALGVPVKVIDKRDEMDLFLRAGGTLILNDSQKQIADELHCEEWPRLRKRLKFPLKRLIQEGLPFGDPEVIRNFYLCRS